MSNMNMLRYTRNVAATAAAIMLGANALSGCGGDDKEQVQATAIEACANVDEFADLSTDPNKYPSESFLPEAGDGLDNRAEVQEYLESNPVVDGDKVDPSSLAAVMSAVTKPANDGKTTSTRYNYAEQFDQSRTEYKVGGVEKAKSDCELTVSTINQVAEYNPSWAQKGDTVVKFVPQRNKNNKIIGMELRKESTNDTLDGAEMKLRETSKGLDGFNSVLITEEGEMFVRGAIVEKQAGKDQDKDRKKFRVVRDKNGKEIRVRVTPQNGGGDNQGGGRGPGRGDNQGGGRGPGRGPGGGGDNGGGEGGPGTPPTQPPEQPPQQPPEQPPENPNPKGDDPGLPEGAPN